MIVYREELWKDAQPDIALLIREHWEEVTDYPHIPLDPDWDRYEKINADGSIKVLTVRDDEFGGILVGYIVFLVFYGLHYRQTFMAQDDAFFLKKEYRKGRVGINMFINAELMLQHHGVKLVTYHEKLKVPCGKLFERLKYKQQEVKWFKEI